MPVEIEHPLTGVIQPYSLYRNLSKRIWLLLFGKGPNIKGRATWTRGSGGNDENGPVISSTGMAHLEKNGSTQSGERIGGGSGDLVLTLDAGISNPVYSDLVSTVQPPSMRALVLIKSF